MRELPIEEILSPRGPAGPPPLHPIGRSRDGREILGGVFGGGGHGGLRISLIGGCHADEPVGPAMLRRLSAFLAALPPDDPLRTGATWYLVPHVNPDGEERNRAWSEVTLPAAGHRGAEDRIYDLPLYLRHVVRERPGDDVEFGFPQGEDDAEARPENRAVASFLAAGAPFHLHGSFHSIAFATGPWFLIEPAWVERTATMREALRERVQALGYRLFDVDRGGEKGFRRIDEGFSTRPDSVSMRRFFEERGEPETAALFRPSSMEHVRSLGGDPLTFVSEMPLFLRPLEDGETGRPDDPSFRAWRARLAVLSDGEVRQEGGARGMPIRDQMRLQLGFLQESLRAVTR